MLPAEVVRRLLDEGDILGLRFRLGSTPVTVHFQVEAVEQPNDLEAFSLGSATAQAVAGTDWQQVQDANSRYLIEPEYEDVIYHAFYGVDPSFAWTYRRYEANVDRGSLLGTRSIGDRTYRVGKVDGMASPYHTPSSRTEFFVLKGTHPAFLGFHPYLEPASITVRLNFVVTVYGVTRLLTPTPEQLARAKVRTIGGRSPMVEAPQWLR